MNYQESLAYLYNLSDFERTGHYTRNPEENLPREAYLLAHLGNPQQNYTCTLIAGTKGKGSTAAFIEQVLRRAGLYIGLSTQPDPKAARERTRAERRVISHEDASANPTELRPEGRRTH